MNINTPSTTTAGNSWTFTTSKKQPEQGWECPRCGAINAPWVRQCDCNDKSWKITCDAEADNILNNSISFDNIDIGGSDYWDDFTKTWSNVSINVSNNKKEK